MPPTFFCFSYFSGKVSLFSWGQTQTANFLPMPPMQLDYRLKPPHWLICWDGISISFCLGSPQTTILPVSPFLVAGVYSHELLCQPSCILYIISRWLYNTSYSVNIVWIIVMLYYLGNNDKKMSCTCSSFENYFQSTVESINAKHASVECWLYTFHINKYTVHVQLHI
jgi:hypothetical protein